MKLITKALSVRQSVHWGGWGPHGTITHDVLNLTIQSSPALASLDMRQALPNIRHRTPALAPVSDT